jgi:UDP-N-acetylglucosamine--N-acetylmuramyl-(pentapeptide) pyrophosphoryl-undecaprenol N-acetylglucosamine transferase
MVIGGSLGSKVINDAVRNSIKTLLLKYNIIHICGKKNLDEKLKDINGYAQFEYVDKELPHFLAAADLVLSRAGANVLFELLALKKPNILIPLSAKSSRGDQILNAASFEKSGYSIVIEEETLNDKILVDKINELYNNKNKYIKNMNSSDLNNGVENILKVIEETREKK